MDRIITVRFFYAARDLLRSEVSLHLLFCTVIVRNVKLANVFSL